MGILSPSSWEVLLVEGELGKGNPPETSDVAPGRSDVLILCHVLRSHFQANEKI